MREQFRGKSVRKLNWAALCLLPVLVCAGEALAAVGGGGPLPIPCFTQNRTGGTAPITIVFDPACTYLPVSPLANQDYVYILSWDFGDGSPIISVGPDEIAANVLTPVSHQYTSQGVYTTTLRVDIAIRDNLKFTTGAVNNPGGHPAGTTTISVDSFAGAIINNSYISIAGEPANTYHRVVSTTADPVGLPQTITMATPLAAAVADNAEIRLYELQPGLSAFTTADTRVSTINYPPLPSILQANSPPDGTLPYELAINVTGSRDQDGFILWAAVDWGDGSCTLVSPAQLTPPAPSNPAATLRHTYTSAGVFAVTVHTIDNGRFDTTVSLSGGTTAPGVPPCNDASVALQTIIAFHNSTFGLPSGNQFEPILRSEFISIEIPGNAVASQGTFKLNFVTKFKDTFDIRMRPNVFLENVANARVVVSVGTAGAGQFTLPAFVTDKKGKFKNKEGFSFQVDGRKQLVRLKFTKSDLAAALRASPTQNVINGFLDVPVRIIINDIYILATTVRFTYNAEATVRGLGTNGRSLDVGN